jgi:hypothetical protein
MNHAQTLYAWCVEYLKDARDSEAEAVDRDATDAVITREANRLETEIYQLASSFVDNTFNGEAS